VPIEKKKLPTEQMRVGVIDADKTSKDQLKTSSIGCTSSFFVQTANSGLNARQMFDKKGFYLVLRNINPPRFKGIGLLKNIKTPCSPR